MSLVSFLFLLPEIIVTSCKNCTSVESSYVPMVGGVIFFQIFLPFGFSFTTDVSS